MKTISSKQVASILGINISTLKRWTESGKIDCEKTAGGHRKFTIKNLRDFYKKTGKQSTRLGEGFSQNLEKKIINDIDNRNYDRLSSQIAKSSLDSDYQTISSIVNGLYMLNIPIEELLDYVIEPPNIILEKWLNGDSITHAENYLARKLITRSLDALLINSNKSNSNGENLLCVNFEHNIPDLGVVMSEVFFNNYGYNVHNTGSHAKLGNLKELIIKKKTSIMLFYLCNQQCCNAVIAKNLASTEQQIKELILFAKALGIKIFFGGEGLKLLPQIKSEIEFKFLNFHELKEMI
tara:strand:+ start:16 stop:897 length:882 start_codon:yes stop_codon:yes gene_type:complete